MPSTGISDQQLTIDEIVSGSLVLIRQTVPFRRERHLTGQEIIEPTQKGQFSPAPLNICGDFFRAPQLAQTLTGSVAD
jgi:hypothetical protein